VTVDLASVRYHSSQPWPFPGSLMVGFTAQAASDALQVDRDELEDARWCVSFVCASLCLRFILPTSLQ
jgi:NADH pyrophosphatase NudC (nudix superfamily)